MKCFKLLIFSIFLSSLISIGYSEEKIIKSMIGDDQLVVIQSISLSRRTFVIRRGAKDQVSINQQSLFSNEKISIACQAIEVSRSFSLWKVIEDHAVIPFNKRDYIIFNNSTDGVWMKIPAVKKRIEQKMARSKIKAIPYWTIRGALSNAYSESVNNTAKSNSNSRRAYQGEVHYNFNVMKKVDMSIGARFDYEVASLVSPSIIIPTNRAFLTGELSYHFPNFQKTQNHIYTAIGLGVGYSKTTVDQTVSTGLALINPALRLGLLTKMSTNYSLIIEGIIESISMHESFADNTEQNTNINNFKFAIGLKF